jgi:hypothetical protein
MQCVTERVEDSWSGSGDFLVATAILTCKWWRQGSWGGERITARGCMA